MPSVPETAPQSAVLRYSNTTVAFHWITVALVLTQAYLGFTFALLLVALILVHIAAALKHQFVDRWRGSARMPPFSSMGEPVAIGQGGESVREG